MSLHSEDLLPDVLSGAGVPLVLCGRPYDGRSVAYVDADNVGGARVAAGALTVGELVSSGVDAVLRVVSVVVAIGVNVALFLAGFALLTTRRVGVAQLLPGAVLAAPDDEAGGHTKRPAWTRQQ